MVVASVDWTVVIVNLLQTLAIIVPAVLAWQIKKQIKTPSGKNIGEQVENTQHVALGNNYRLQGLTGELSVAIPPEAEKHEQVISELNGETTPPSEAG